MFSGKTIGRVLGQLKLRSIWGRQLRYMVMFAQQFELQAVFFNIGLGFNGFAGQQIAQEDDPDYQSQKYTCKANGHPSVLGDDGHPMAAEFREQVGNCKQP